MVSTINLIMSELCLVAVFQGLSVDDDDDSLPFHNDLLEHLIRTELLLMLLLYSTCQSDMTEPFMLALLQR